jgi:hypothetical protein
MKRARATIVGALLVGVIIVGCGKEEAPTQPAPVPDPPELTAWDLYLYWGSIGPTAPRGAAPSALLPAARTGSAAEVPLVVVGTGALPNLRMTSNVGTSIDYHVHFFVDDVLWWDVSAVQRPISPGWYDLGGLPWVPADTGLHVLRAVIDPTQRVAEVDETNNERSLTVRVIPGDLVAGLLRFVVWEQGYPREVTSVKVGTPVLVVAESFARGRYLNHRAVLDACGSVLLDHRVSLAGGTIWAQIRDDTLAFTPQIPGDCLIRFTVDPDGEFLMDLDRSNNVSERTLSVHQ